MAGNEAQAPSGSGEAGLFRSKLMGETNHSTIETCQWQGTVAIIKRCRNRDDPRTSVRLRTEISVLKAVGEHESITQILDSDTSQLTITLRFELGQSLDKWVDERERSQLTPSDCATIWSQMASGLAYLHSMSIIHDDVKPDNIMWSGEHKRSVLIDFGAALLNMPEGYFNPSGTPSYAPPEFLSQKKGAKDDIWALGITMLFAFGYTPLPRGGWLLPAVWDAANNARLSMLQWLAQVEQLRDVMKRDNPLAAAMLDADPDARISSSELHKRLVG
ncbi:kinase-like domain-containing protein [Xylariales sp. AK1849]|nr:kinase-like domain-containing protein [Xylariales sp. AK1849]